MNDLCGTMHLAIHIDQQAFVTFSGWITVLRVKSRQETESDRKQYRDALYINYARMPSAKRLCQHPCVIYEHFLNISYRVFYAAQVISWKTFQLIDFLHIWIKRNGNRARLFKIRAPISNSKTLRLSNDLIYAQSLRWKEENVGYRLTCWPQFILTFEITIILRFPVFFFFSTENYLLNRIIIYMQCEKSFHLKSNL